MSTRMGPSALTVQSLTSAGPSLTSPTSAATRNPPLPLTTALSIPSLQSLNSLSNTTKLTDTPCTKDRLQPSPIRSPPAIRPTRVVNSPTPPPRTLPSPRQPSTSPAGGGSAEKEKKIPNGEGASGNARRHGYRLSPPRNGLVIRRVGAHTSVRMERLVRRGGGKDHEKDANVTEVLSKHSPCQSNSLGPGIDLTPCTAQRYRGWT